MMQSWRSGLTEVVATVGLFSLAACGGGNANVPIGLPTPTPTVTATHEPTPSPTRTARGVQGLVVVGGDMRATEGDALGPPPPGWGKAGDVVSFDRALAFADLILREDGNVVTATGPNGQFEIEGLSPGRYTLVLTKTMNGVFVNASVPIVVGEGGTAMIEAQVANGSVRTRITYQKQGATYTEIFGPYGTHLVARDGRIVELADYARRIVDNDGDGLFEPSDCSDPVVVCDPSLGFCDNRHACQCTASCPFCEDCGLLVCAPFGPTQLYACREDGRCALDGDRCVCVSSCPDCDDCVQQVCVPSCNAVRITGIVVSGPSHLIEGRRGNMFAVAQLSDGNVMDVTHLVDWTSSAPDVVSVDSWGVVTALSVGGATISARLGEHVSFDFGIQVIERPPLRRIYLQNASCYYPLGIDPHVGGSMDGVILPVPPPRDDILPVPYCNQVVRLGGTIQFIAIGEFGEGSEYEDITREVTWTVDRPEVGTISAGLFTGVAEGRARITASLGEVRSDSTEVRVVTQPTIVYLKIYADNWGYRAIEGGPIRPGSDVFCPQCGYVLTILRGDTLRFRATAQYDTGEWEDVTDRVLWLSSNAAAATIDGSGVLTAVEQGEARVTSSLGELTSNPIDVRVVNEATLQSLSIYPEGTDRVVARGAQIYFRATGFYDIGFARDVTAEARWISSDETIGGFDMPGVLSGRAAGVVQVWASLDGHESERYSIEVYATGELDYCDPTNMNRAVWSDQFNRVTLESDCHEYTPPDVVALRYTVVETQPHGGIFDPCLDLYVLDGERIVRTLREEGCGEPFLPRGAPELDAAILKYQYLAFWDLKDDRGRQVAPGKYTIFGRFYLYYDPVVSIDVTVLGNGSVTRTPTPTPTPAPRCTPVPCENGNLVCPRRECPGGCGYVCAPPTPRDVMVVIGEAVARFDSVVEVPVMLRSGGAAVAGVQNDIRVDSRMRILSNLAGRPDCRVNPKIDKSATTFTFLRSCPSNDGCTAMRAIVVSLDNLDPIPDGSVLYTCRFEVPANMPERYPIICDNAVAADPRGSELPAGCANGVIHAGAR